MAAKTSQLSDLLPPEQCRQLAELLGPVLSGGFGSVSLVIENHQVKFIQVTRSYATQRGKPPDFFVGEVVRT